MLCTQLKGRGARNLKLSSCFLCTAAVCAAHQNLLCQRGVQAAAAQLNQELLHSVVAGRKQGACEARAQLVTQAGQLQRRQEEQGWQEGQLRCTRWRRRVFCPNICWCERSSVLGRAGDHESRCGGRAGRCYLLDGALGGSHLVCSLPLPTCTPLGSAAAHNPDRAHLGHLHKGGQVGGHQHINHAFSGRAQLAGSSARGSGNVCSIDRIRVAASLQGGMRDGAGQGRCIWLVLAGLSRRNARSMWQLVDQATSTQARVVVRDTLQAQQRHFGQCIAASTQHAAQRRLGTLGLLQARQRVSGTYPADGIGQEHLINLMDHCTARKQKRGWMTWSYEGVGAATPSCASHPRAAVQCMLIEVPGHMLVCTPFREQTRQYAPPYCARPMVVSALVMRAVLPSSSTRLSRPSWYLACKEQGSPGAAAVAGGQQASNGLSRPSMHPACTAHPTCSQTSAMQGTCSSRQRASLARLPHTLHRFLSP